MRISRRTLLKSASAAVIVSPFIPARAQGANSRLRMAVIGVGGRGNDHVSGFGAMEDVEVVKVVDPNRLNAENTAKRWSEKLECTIEAVSDARRVFEDDAIDAVSVATCNHWHSLMAYWACQAGKHVYVEKPLSHTFREGRLVAEAAKKAGVCVQHGTQRRSDSGHYRAAAAFRSGRFGAPVAVYAYANRPRNPVGFKPITDPPAHIDWDLWLGPVDLVPYHGNLVPYNWHWFWNTGDGEIGNNGVHYFDMCRLGLGDPHVHPRSVVSFGTRFVADAKNNFRDQAQTPNIQVALYEYADGIPCYFESCNLRSEGWTPLETARFYTSEGFFANGRFYANDGAEVKLDDVEFTGPQPSGHFRNFINCVLANAPEKLNAPVEEGHYSTALCHLANASYRLGAPASLDDCLAALGDHPLMLERCEVMLQNVQAALGGLGVADIRKDVPFQLGPKCVLDSASESIPGNAAANALLSRPGRGAYVFG